MGTLVAPQCEEGADGRPRKSLATVLLYRGEVRRWRTSVRYADHVTTVACRWLLCPFGHLWLCHPPAAVFWQKRLVPRRFALYSPPPGFGWIRSIKIIQLYTPMPKRRQIKGSKWPKGIAADAKMTRFIVRSPGGPAAAILRAAFDMRLTLVPAHGPSP